MSNQIQKTIGSTIAMLVHFAQVVWTLKLNYRDRERYGSFDAIRNSLAERGWSDQNPIPCSNPAEDWEVKAALAERQKDWDTYKDALKHQDNDENRAKLAVFIDLYTEPVDAEKPDGERKLIVPIYSGNAGFRRSQAYFSAMVQRRRRKADDGMQVDTDTRIMIPIQPKVYPTLADRIYDQQLENELQGVGTVKMDPLDKLRVVKALKDQGWREAQVRSLYNQSTTVQKLYGIARANDNWPTLNIFQRFYLDPANPDFIPLSRVRHNEIVPYNVRFRAAQKRAEGLPLSEDEKAAEPFKDEYGPDGKVTAYEIDNYFRDLAARERGDGTPQSRMLKKEEIKAMLDSPVLAVRSAANHVYEGIEPKSMKAMVAFKDALNIPFDLVTSGKGELMEGIANAVKDHETLMADINKVIAAGKVNQLKAAVNLILNPPAPTENKVETVVENTTPATPENKVEPTPVETPAEPEKKPLPPIPSSKKPQRTR